MSLKMQIVVAVASVALPSSEKVAPQSATVARVTESPSVSVAKANKGLVATDEQFVSRPALVWPVIEAERALGHHGFAEVSGIVGLDGKVTDTVLSAKTGAPALDEMALSVARGSTFLPAKNRAGVSIPVWTTIGFQFPGRFQRTKLGGGLAVYRCEDFAGDMTWWKSAIPARPWRKNKLFSELAGLNWYKTDFSKNSDDALIVEWEKTLEFCKQKPQTLLLEAWQGKVNFVRALFTLVGN